MGVGRGAATLPCKKKIVEKPLRNSAGFCGGGQGLSWAVEPRKEEIRRRILHIYVWRISLWSQIIRMTDVLMLLMLIWLLLLMISVIF
jgi:hypothetical protein